MAASGDEKGKAKLEKENVQLKEELSSLPELKKELESLRARLTELSQLTGMENKTLINLWLVCAAAYSLFQYSLK